MLRGEWNFPGFVVSDWMDIEHIHDLHATAENLKEAFYQSIMGGMDMHMHGIHWNEMVVELVRRGVSQNLVLTSLYAAYWISNSVSAFSNNLMPMRPKP